MSTVRYRICWWAAASAAREDMSVQHHAALLAYVARVPVKVKLTRQESILIHPKRHSFDMDFTMGCDENGIIQGVKANVVSDTGAFASLGGPVLERACTHAAGPYAYENFEIEGCAYYTNNPPRRRLPGLRCHPDLLLHGDAAQRDGGSGGHLSLGDPVPQRHSPRRCAAQRPDRG